MKHTARNKPCPCNSGKKFKKCCWNPIDGPQWSKNPPLILESQTDTLNSTRKERGLSLHTTMAMVALLCGTFPSRK